MNDIILLILATLGTLFILLAAVGFVRMPDAFLRISVTTKAVTLGVGLILGGAAFHFDNLSVTTRVLAIIFFVFLTAPVSAHLIGRTAYFRGIKLWKKSKIDELKEKYNPRTHRLSSGDDLDKKTNSKKNE